MGTGDKVITFRECVAPASAAEVQAFEARVGCSFPPALKRLFFESNGGRPSPNGYRDDEIDTDVRCLPLREGRNTALTTYEIMVCNKRLVPKHFVPFAMDSGANCFFVDCESPDGLVYLYVHDTAYEHLRSLNVTINDFFIKLTDDE